MSPDGVRQQVMEIIGRLIAASISVKQHYPSIRQSDHGSTVIGRRPSTAIAMRDVPYDEVYREIELNEAYDVKLIDGGLLIFQYSFDRGQKLLEHRLAYFPSPILPSVDEAPTLYEHDHLYGDIIARRLVRFPIRFDYAPVQWTDVVHPASHLTFGQYENCRIPVSGPLSPDSFCMFIIRNFYCRVYKRHKNKFDRHMTKLTRLDTLSHAERRISHFVPGR